MLHLLPIKYRQKKGIALNLQNAVDTLTPYPWNNVKSSVLNVSRFLGGLSQRLNKGSSSKQVHGVREGENIKVNVFLVECERVHGFCSVCCPPPNEIFVNFLSHWNWERDWTCSTFHMAEIFGDDWKNERKRRDRNGFPSQGGSAPLVKLRSSDIQQEKNCYSFGLKGTSRDCPGDFVGILLANQTWSNLPKCAAQVVKCLNAPSRRTCSCYLFLKITCEI